jgi:DHA2 family multidrug resistance protein
MSSAGSITADQVAWQPKVNQWAIGVVVSLAAFMEVLDTSIANVALLYIAGNLGASNHESTWVLTSYLVSNAIVLPINGFLVGWLGRKRFFLTCIVSFTVSSFLCGAAPSLGLLLLFRVMQGAFGGGLQPMAQAILADTFPPEKQGLAFALYGITVVCAPAIGPTLGGWITDNYVWRWIFYINVPLVLSPWCSCISFFKIRLTCPASRREPLDSTTSASPCWRSGLPPSRSYLIRDRKTTGSDLISLRRSSSSLP